jgi:hypothetical protein
MEDIQTPVVVDVAVSVPPPPHVDPMVMEDEVGRTADLVLTEEERAEIAKAVADATASHQRTIDYHTARAETLRRELEQLPPKAEGAATAHILARRRLVAAGLTFHTSWDGRLVADLGHLGVRDRDRRIREATVAVGLGRLAEDAKEVEVAERDGKKVLRTTIPLSRGPVSIRFTTPDKGLKCRIVRQVSHQVLCTATEPE